MVEAKQSSFTHYGVALLTKNMAQKSTLKNTSSS